MGAENEENLQKAQRIAWMFRFISPSYYIPGEQSWGASLEESQKPKARSHKAGMRLQA